MGYDSWLTGIYNRYDAMFKFYEAQDNIYQLEKVIIEKLGKEYLWGENGDYKMKLKDEYEGFKRCNTTDGEPDDANNNGSE